MEKYLGIPEIVGVVGLCFRGFCYMLLGVFLEVSFSVFLIEKVTGAPVAKRVSKNHLEGHISLYMYPLHALGMVFGFELVLRQMVHLQMGVRYLIWCVLFTAVEFVYGMLLHKFVGLFPWDYYKLSKYKIGKNGYSLYTIIPLWGVAGVILEQASLLLQFLSPFAVNYFFDKIQ